MHTALLVAVAVASGLRYGVCMSHAIDQAVLCCVAGAR
jgi:hypothetical protein